MAIIRPPQPDDGYFQVRRAWVRDPRTTYKGKGILAAILSHNEAWDLTTEQLIAQSADGKAAVNSGLRELEEVGYLTRVKMRRATAEDSKKRAGTYAGYDLILTEPPPHEESRSKGVKRHQPKQVARVPATTNQKPVSGPDQGFRGSTTSRFSGAGSSGAGESDTKKEQGLEDQGIENQPSLSDSSTSPSSGDRGQDQRGSDSSPDSEGQPQPPDERQIKTLVAELVQVAKAAGEPWKYADQRVRAVLMDRHVAVRPFPVIRAGLLELAAQRHGRCWSPALIGMRDSEWWEGVAYRLEGPPKVPGQRDAPPPDRRKLIRECGRCDSEGWYFDPAVPDDRGVPCDHSPRLVAVS